jgi:hypothetical protein
VKLLSGWATGSLSRRTRLRGVSCLRTRFCTLIEMKVACLRHDVLSKLFRHNNPFFLFIRGVGWDWFHSVHRPLVGPLYQLWMMYQCGAIGGNRIVRGDWSTRRKPAPVPLCRPQIPHDNLGSSPDGRGGKPATNRLNYGTAVQHTSGYGRCHPIIRQTDKTLHKKSCSIVKVCLHNFLCLQYYAPQNI